MQLIISQTLKYQKYMTDIKSLSDRIEIIPRKRIEDSRGWFLKTLTGKEDGLPNRTGEIYTVFSERGASRGGHFHKEAREWFTLLTGKSKLHLKDTNTGELFTIELDSANPITVVIPPFVAHRFDSIDNESFLLLAYTDEIYNPADTISLNY
jgi:dTDP-4-dehydrorhamnose 3,5-epimerase-like enzyme